MEKLIKNKNETKSSFVHNFFFKKKNGKEPLTPIHLCEWLRYHTCQGVWYYEGTLKQFSDTSTRMLRTRSTN